MEIHGSPQYKGLVQQATQAEKSSFARDEGEADTESRPSGENDIGSGQQDPSALPQPSASSSDRIQWSAQAPSKSREISAETRARWELLKALAGVDHHGSPAEQHSTQAGQRPPEPYNSLRRNRSQRKRQTASPKQSPGGSMRPLMLPQMVRNDMQSSKGFPGREAPGMQQTLRAHQSPPREQPAGLQQPPHRQQPPQAPHSIHKQPNSTSSPPPHPQEDRQRHSASQQDPPLKPPPSPATSRIPLQNLSSKPDITHGIAPDYNLSPRYSQQPHPGNSPLTDRPGHHNASQTNLNQPIQTLASTLFSGFPTIQPSLGAPSTFTQETAIQEPQPKRPTSLTDHNANPLSNAHPRLPLPSPPPVLATSRSPAPSSVASPVSSIASSNGIVRLQPPHAPPSPEEEQSLRLPHAFVDNSTAPPPIAARSEASPTAHPPNEAKTEAEVEAKAKVNDDPNQLISSSSRNSPAPITRPPNSTTPPLPPTPSHPSPSSTSTLNNTTLDYATLLTLPPEEVLYLLASGQVPPEFLSSPDGVEWVMEGQFQSPPLCSSSRSSSSHSFVGDLRSPSFLMIRCSPSLIPC